MRRLMYVRLALLGAVLVAVLVLHLHGSALHVLQVARIVIVMLILVAALRLRRQGPRA